MTTSEDTTGTQAPTRGPADRPAALRRVRSLLLRSPALVRVAKQVYRWPPLTRSRPFRWAIGRRVAAADAALPTLTPRIAIETVLTCNAKCSMCVHSEKRMVGVMSMELFTRLIDECAQWGVKEVGLSVYGEPLVDKHWMERVKLVRKAGLNYTFFSNASLLTEEKAAAMLDMGGWAEVNFSVNGYSKEVYESVMPPLSRERVYGNIEKFLELRRKRGGGPKVTVSCVSLQENVHELDDYERYWSSRVDRVSIADRTDWLGELKKTDIGQGVHKRLRVMAGDVWKQPCPTVWSSMFVYYDGRVAPCCEDAGLRELILGDTNEQSLREIFLGPTLTAIREEHKRGERCGTCSKCHVNWPWI